MPPLGVSSPAPDSRGCRLRLVGALTRPQNQFGLPAIPTVTCVGGTWCDGASLPVRRLPDDEMERSTPVTLPRNLVA